MITVLKNERVITVDIDGTLVMHSWPEKFHSGDTVEFVDVIDTLDNSKTIRLRINKPMVRLVREEMKRGSQIIFWSRGGHQWAFNVITALGFAECKEHIVIMTKPYAYFDDKDCSEWLRDRVYLSPDTRYKL